MRPIDAETEVVSEATTVAGGLRLIRKRYPMGLRMGRHAHDEWRFCLALRGTFTDSWRRTYRTRMPRQLSLHAAGESHTSVFHTATACFHIEFTGLWRQRLLGAFGLADASQEFLTGRVPLLAGQLHDEFRHRDESSPLVLEGLACELIGWAARSARRDERKVSWLDRVRDLLHERWSESLTLSEIAAAADVHPVHLARVFRQQCGCTIGEYVRRLRVEFVCAQLATNVSLAELALRAGFADQSHLTRVFKRQTGLTPHRYRSQR